MSASADLRPEHLDVGRTRRAPPSDVPKENLGAWLTFADGSSGFLGGRRSLFVSSTLSEVRPKEGYDPPPGVTGRGFVAAGS
jgi:hypothetical protein